MQNAEANTALAPETNEASPASSQDTATTVQTKATKPTPRYDHLFKLLVLARLARGDLNAKHLARAVGVSPWVVYSWRRDYGEEAARLFPDASTVADENARMKAALTKVFDGIRVLQDMLATSATAPSTATEVPEGMTERLGNLKLSDLFPPNELLALVRGAQHKAA
jgi:transposase-like protein